MTFRLLVHQLKARDSLHWLSRSLAASSLIRAFQRTLAWKLCFLLNLSTGNQLSQWLVRERLSRRRLYFNEENYTGHGLVGLIVSPRLWDHSEIFIKSWSWGLWRSGLGPACLAIWLRIHYAKGISLHDVYAKVIRKKTSAVNLWTCLSLGTWRGYERPC